MPTIRWVNNLGNQLFILLVIILLTAVGLGGLSVAQPANQMFKGYEQYFPDNVLIYPEGYECWSYEGDWMYYQHGMEVYATCSEVQPNTMPFRMITFSLKSDSRMIKSVTFYPVDNALLLGDVVEWYGRHSINNTFRFAVLGHISWIEQNHAQVIVSYRHRRIYSLFIPVFWIKFLTPKDHLAAMGLR